MIRNGVGAIIGAGMPRSKVVRYKIVHIEIYTIGWLAMLSQLARVTLRGWEKKDILPKPVFKINGNIRYYSPKELELYVLRIKAHYAGNRDIHELTRNLHDARITAEKYYKGVADNKANSGLTVKLASINALRVAFKTARNAAIVKAGSTLKE